MSYELITILMFALMMLMLATGQRVFAAIGFVAVLSALLLWGDRGGYDLGFAAAMKLMKWYPLLTLPMFIFMGYVLSESKIADDLYRMFHVWTGGVAGGLAMGTIGLMVLVSAMNGLSVAGMAIGATIALPELLKRNYDKRMVTGVIQAGSSLGILVPPSVVLVLYAMIARQPVGQLWLAGIFPGLMMAALFVVYIWLRCWITPSLGPVLPEAERDVGRREKFRLLRAGLLPLFIYAVMIVPFVSGSTSLVESSAIGALAAFLAAVVRRRMTRVVLENSVRNTLRISCMFMWIILAALAFGSVFDGLGAAHAIEDVFTEHMGLSPWMVLILMQLSFLVMGTFLDDTAMLVIVAPLYVPLVDALGFNLIWYGALLPWKERPVDVDDGAGSVAGRAGGEEGHDVRHFLGRNQRAERVLCERSAIASLVDVIPRHVGAHPAGSHRIGEDALAPVVAGDGVAQCIESALTRRIGAEQRLLAAMRGPARQVDQDAAAPRPEVLDGLSSERGGGQQVDLQRALPDGAPGRRPASVIGDLRLVLVDGGVVHQHVDSTLPGERLPPERVGRLLVSEIGAHQKAAIGRSLRQCLGCLPARVVMDDDGGTAIEQRADAAGANAARCAGDQHHLAVDADRVARFAIFRHDLPRHRLRLASLQAASKASEALTIQ